MAIRLATVAVTCWLLSACASHVGIDSFEPLSNAERLPASDVSVQIPGLSNCTHADDTELQIDRSRPVVVIVHGCFSSAGRFRSLADVFAFHGQQTFCFNYDDRDSITQSSAELITAIEQLSEVLQAPDITVIGHSQGGLVARRAFIEEREDRFVAHDVQINLVTVSAPFAGIEASAHCGWTALQWLSLGLVHPICQIITGSKYREIPPGSDFIEHPGGLLPIVSSHLRIATDEAGTCRRLAEDGHCLEDDFVFSVAEQIQATVEQQEGLFGVEVAAGHVEIVGDGSSTPIKLIAILQGRGVLNPTPTGREVALAALLVDLYLSPERAN